MTQDAESNDRLPTVFVPSLMCTPALYSTQLSAMWAFGPVCVADHRSDDTMAAIARRLLSNAPPRFRLVGLSMGGYVALEVMRQAPERVAALALLDTTAHADSDEQRRNRLRQVELAQSAGLHKVAAQMYQKQVDASRRDDNTLKSLVVAMSQQVGIEGFARQQAANASRPDSRNDLGVITCPTLVLVGANDELTPPDRAREMADAIRDSTLVVVPECGHLSAIEQPQAVNEALLRWAER